MFVILVTFRSTSKCKCLHLTINNQFSSEIETSLLDCYDNSMFIM